MKPDLKATLAILIGMSGAIAIPTASFAADAAAGAATAVT